MGGPDIILEDRIDFLFEGLDYDLCKIIIGDFTRIQKDKYGVHIRYAK